MSKYYNLAARFSGQKEAFSKGLKLFEETEIDRKIKYLNEDGVNIIFYKIEVKSND